MAKNQRNNDINRNIDTYRNQAQRDYEDYSRGITARIPGVAARSDALYNDVLGGYRGLIPRIQGNAGRYSALFNNRGGELSNWARNSITPENQNRMRGLGVFDEFARTGGWDDRAKTDFLGSVSASVPRFYANVRDAMDRGSLASGGYSPGYGTQVAKLTRDAAFGANSAIREGRLGLQKSINEGRQWGATGASDSEARLQSLLSSNYLGGMGLANDSYRMGYGADTEGLNAEGNIYDSMRGLYSAVPAELMALYGMQGDALNSKNAALGSYINSDIQNNPRQAPWWQTALNAAAPIGSAFLMGGGGPLSSSNRGGVTGRGRVGTPYFRPSNPWDDESLYG